MVILGVNEGHHAGACLLVDGEIRLASLEERRVNQKNYAGIPKESLKACFDRTGVAPQDVDAVALSSLIRTTVPTREHKHVDTLLRWLSWLGRGEFRTKVGRFCLSRLRKKRELLTFLKELGLGDVPILPFDHHTSHAACAYYHRHWDDDALVLTLDGAGDGYCARVFRGVGNTLVPLAATPKYHSLSTHMYSAMTAHLGLKPYEHEYKVMGMAPYGQLDGSYEILKSLFRVDGLQFRNLIGLPPHWFRRYYARRLAGYRFDNLAAACQRVFEELLVQWVCNAMQETGLRRLACAGGAFLNVKANMLIRTLDDVDEFYVYPASDDGGTPVGAAVLGYLEMCDRRQLTPKLRLSEHLYLGLSFSDKEMLSAIEDAGLPFTHIGDAAGQIAELLANGRIVARFNGAEEWGPRALGNRTIMADPRDLKVIRKLNFAIKQRDFWMPFAASILEEDADRYLQNASARPFYMIEAFDTHDETLEEIIAGTHPYDGTVRPQLVNDWNPSYKQIIQEFKKRTGVGALLNTSFNLHGSPIVGSPETALYTFQNSELDALVMGPYLLTKKNGNTFRRVAGRERSVAPFERANTLADHRPLIDGATQSLTPRHPAGPPH